MSDYFISLWKSSFLLIHLFQIWLDCLKQLACELILSRNWNLCIPTCGFDFFFFFCIIVWWVQLIQLSFYACVLLPCFFWISMHTIWNDCLKELSGELVLSKIEFLHTHLWIWLFCNFCWLGSILILHIFFRIWFLCNNYLSGFISFLFLVVKV